MAPQEAARELELEDTKMQSRWETLKWASVRYREFENISRRWKKKCINVPTHQGERINLKP